MARRGPKPTLPQFDNDGPSARLDTPVTFEQMYNLVDRASRHQLTDAEALRLRTGLSNIEDGERIIRELTTQNSQLNARVRVLMGLFHELRALADFWETKQDLFELRMAVLGVRRYVGMAFKDRSIG